ncbi:hypothetical protein [Sphingosinicella humi]|uniref:Uncharacterized protein n=1 Tax=Allosphingosinicella humi TaxID=2068657 RepID=A0A2U2J0M2_9SPHN|nr:hypothetical protein [Sphingosinicella humi]PWG01857.1 hypothetical protein DF286_02435 [Sphingosinicella humi]
MKRIINASGAAPTLFPSVDFDAFLAYLRAVWAEIKALSPKWWTAKKETDLVGGFYVMLNDDESQLRHGVGFGHFFYEPTEVEINPKTNMPKPIGRTDIQFAYAAHMGPRLTIEFKRLNNKSPLRQKYFSQGVSRFVSGKYAPSHDTALMVGLVEGSATNEKAGLLKYLRLASTKASLALQPITHPEYGDPSKHGPAVDFDTLHKRPTNCSCEEITIGHILLER